MLIPDQEQNEKCESDPDLDSHPIAVRLFLFKLILKMGLRNL